MGDKDNTTFPAKHQYEKLKKLLELDNRYDEIIEEEEREVIGQKTSGLGSGATYAFTDKNNFANNVVDITAPSTELAKQWDGWGTALKPSFEPIMMCQKPLEKGYCYNIEKHGIGGLNINGCRLDYKNNFPSNTILTDNILKEYNKFFMIPKPNKGDKTENGQINNNHPTIKPTELIRQLIKLITPENGLCIDICEGSGTHVKACLQLTNEGYLVNYMGFENDEDSYNTACEREKLNKVS
jgi:site-specific DNA-methyltransferase (adenine-specific)